MTRKTTGYLQRPRWYHRHGWIGRWLLTLASMVVSFAIAEWLLRAIVADTTKLDVGLVNMALSTPLQDLNIVTTGTDRIFRSGQMPT